MILVIEILWKYASILQSKTKLCVTTAMELSDLRQLKKD